MAPTPKSIFTFPSSARNNSLGKQLLTGTHMKSPSEGRFVFTKQKVEQNHPNYENTQFTETQFGDNVDSTPFDDNEIENVLIGSIRPSKQEEI
jgi:hypothetical protein